VLREVKREKSLLRIRPLPKAADADAHISATARQISTKIEPIIAGGSPLVHQHRQHRSPSTATWQWARIDGEGLPLSTGSNFGEIGLVVAEIWGIEGGGVVMTMIIINGYGVAEASCFYLCIVPYIQYFVQTIK
jgi:hypothetical protein